MPGMTAAVPPIPRPYAAPGSIKTPLLISAIANIVLALVWLTIFCFPVSAGLVVLCIFEFRLYSQADTLRTDDFIEQAKKLAIFEIVGGLFNTPTLICGVLILVNAPAAKRQYGIPP